VFPLILSQIFAKIRRWRRARKGKSLKIRLGELMAPWTFEVKFPYGTQFLFGTLMFTAGEDRTIKLLTHSPSPSHHELIYGEAPYYPVDPSTALASGGTRSGLNPYAGSYAPIAMTSWGHPIEAPVAWSPARTSSPTSSGASTSRDTVEDYPEIMGSVYWDPAIKAHRISMVGPTRASSHNSSNRYPT
jgi:hypothetical protein